MIRETAIRTVRGAHWSAQLRAKLAGFDGEEMAWMEQHTDLIKSSSHSRVGLLQLNGSLCYLKFFRAKSYGQLLLFRLGRARAIRSFDIAEQLLKEQIAVPEPLACLLLPAGLMLLTQGISEGQDLEAFWPENPEESVREMLLIKAGRILSRLHVAGFYHGDFKWSNLLWSDDSFYLVDLEAVKKITLGVMTAPVCKKRARDLARFTLNAEEQFVSPEKFELFLSSYLEGAEVSRELLVQAMLPFLRRMRERHKVAYGICGQRVLGEP